MSRGMLALILIGIICGLSEYPVATRVANTIQHLADVVGGAR